MSDDDDLWEFVSRSVEPIERGKLYVPPIPQTSKEREESPAPLKKPVKSKPQFSASQKLEPKQHAPNDGLDRRTAERLRKGQMSIDARLDLHGMSRAEAYSVLRHFLRTSQASGCRCVLVITGKGSGGKTSDQFWDGHGENATGVLKQNVPLWLDEPDLAAIILKVTYAQPKDGGHGALYVLLRRQR